MDTIATTEHPLSERIVELPGGVRIGCAEYGDPDGLPVLALHGTPGSRLMFALSDRAARDRGLRLIAPERPGYGLSDFRHFETLAQSTGDLSGVADAYGLDQFAIIGVSGGGPFAVAAAAAMPDRISLLALVGPVGDVAESRISMSKLHWLMFKLFPRVPRGPRLFFRSLNYVLREAPETAYRLLLRRVTASDREVLARPEVKASLRAAVREGLRPGTEGAVQDLRLYCAPWRLRLSEIDVPAVVWQGSDDTIVPPAAAYALARALPNCRLDIIPGAGHYWVFGEFGLILDAVAVTLRADAGEGGEASAETRG